MSDWIPCTDSDEQIGGPSVLDQCLEVMQPFASLPMDPHALDTQLLFYPGSNGQTDVSKGVKVGDFRRLATLYEKLSSEEQ